MEYGKWLPQARAKFDEMRKVLLERHLTRQAEDLARRLSAASPRRTGRLARSWMVQGVQLSGEALKARVRSREPYAKRVDQGGRQHSRGRALGMIVPVGSPRFVPGGNYVTIRRQKYGNLAVVIDRNTRQVVAVRKRLVVTRPRPFIAKTIKDWRTASTQSALADFRNLWRR